MKKSLFLFLLFFLSLSCSKSENRLLFHAGAGQRSSLDEVAKVFTKKYPNIKVDFAYKGSGYLLADITTSHEGDLYMPGEKFYLMQAYKKGYIIDYNPKKDIAAYFIPVIITPKGNPKHIKTIEDFAKPGIRVGLGDSEACAIGIWHEKIFKKAGIYEKVKKNATMFAKCIPELGNACQLKAIDATIVWSPTAVLYLKDIEIIPIEPKYGGLIPLPVGILKFTKHYNEAKLLKNFILSNEGKKIFHSHAYCINPEQAEQDLRWLVEAAKVAKDPSIPVTKETVGSLVKEVKRQRISRR